MNRRKFLIGLSAIVAAPAIVRASSLMPVRSIEPFSGSHLIQLIDFDHLNTLLMEALNSLTNPPVIVENVHDINQTSELAAALPFGTVIRIGGTKLYDHLKIAAIRKHRAEWTALHSGAKLLPRAVGGLPGQVR